MLPAAHRLTSPEQFRATVRRGRRRGATTVVAHLLTEPGQPDGTRAGLVVSRAVGGSVVRNRVKRRLRHLLRDRIGGLPDGSWLVVRALPPAATASSAELGGDLDHAVSALTSRSGASR